VCVGDVPYIVEKILTRITTLLETLLRSKVCTKIMGIQSRGSLNFGNFETHNLRVLRQNDIWVQAMWLSIENIIRGKVVISLSPKHGEFCGSMFARGTFLHQKCSNYTLTNLFSFL
jgi:hypothetical protein